MRKKTSLIWILFEANPSIVPPKGPFVFSQGFWASSKKGVSKKRMYKFLIAPPEKLGLDFLYSNLKNVWGTIIK